MRILVTLLFLFSTLIAQEATTEKSTHSSGGFGGFMIGGSQMDISQLNSDMNAHNYSSFSKSSLTLGGGGYAIIDGWLIGGEGGSILGQRGQSNDRLYRTTLSGNYGFFEGGYQWIHKGNFHLYSVAGIGGGTMTVAVHPRIPIDFNDALGTPQREVRLRARGVLMNASIGGMIHRTKYKEKNGRIRGGGLFVGFVGGYIWSPVKPQWKWSGGDVDGAPDAGFQGPYLRLFIGGFGWSDK